MRKDLKSPDLRFVIGQMGVDGGNASVKIQKFKDAHASAAHLPDFKGNVAVVKTEAFWDGEADAVYKKGWRENKAEWDMVGSDYPFHYLGSARTLCRIGRAFGEAMLELRGGK